MSFTTRRVYLYNKQRFGAVAQLAEHLICIQGVRGSNPLSSTKIDIKLIVQNGQLFYLGDVTPSSA